MKERQEGKEVKTSTLKILLTLFSFVWWVISIIAIMINSPILSKETIISIVVSAFFSIFLSFLTVSVIAILLRWKI